MLQIQLCIPLVGLGLPLACHTLYNLHNITNCSLNILLLSTLTSCSCIYLLSWHFLSYGNFVAIGYNIWCRNLFQFDPAHSLVNYDTCEAKAPAVIVFYCMGSTISKQCSLWNYFIFISNYFPYMIFLDLLVWHINLTKYNFSLNKNILSDESAKLVENYDWSFQWHHR